MKIRKRHTANFKAKVAKEALREKLTASEIASNFAINPTMVSQWKKIANDNLHLLYESKDNKSQLKVTNFEESALLEEIGKLTVELGWLKKNAVKWGLM